MRPLIRLAIGPAAAYACGRAGHGRSAETSARHPSVSRSSGQRVITLSRRIEDREGRFAGIVRASVLVQHFERHYKRMSLQSQGMVTLAMTDGLSAWPPRSRVPRATEPAHP